MIPKILYLDWYYISKEDIRCQFSHILNLTYLTLSIRILQKIYLNNFTLLVPLYNKICFILL